MFDFIDVAGSFTPVDFKGADCRCSLLDYTVAGFPDYAVGDFQRRLAGILEQFSADVATQRSPRVIVQAPPRHGKSMLASERLPAWHIGKHPSHEAVVASYGLAVAQDRTKAARDLVLSDDNALVFPWATISRDTAAKANWQLEGFAGSLRAVGRTGPLTGRGAHMLILDDLVKDYADALSPVQRDAVWKWYLSTAYTRLAPGGGILIIMTRWHEDDLVGRVLLEQASENWVVHSFPAIATHDDDWRSVGDALHPERFPIERLEAIQEALGSGVFQALYQQTPTTPGGSVWHKNWFKHCEKPPIGKIVQSWDLTFKETAKGSFVVGQVWSQHRGKYYLLEEYRGRWGFVETRQQITAALDAWPKTSRILIEDKANGPAIIDEMRGKLGRRLIAVQPDGSKLARAHAVAGAIEAGKVYLPSPDKAEWVEPFLKEVSSFPAAANDDRVDATSQALRYLTKATKLRAGHL